MKSSRCLLFILLTITSCTNEKRLANERLILGNWVDVRLIHYGMNQFSGFALYNAQGFTFYPNHTFDNKEGHYRNERKNHYDNYGEPDGPLTYLGTLSGYKITDDDSLRLFDPGNKHWDNYKIVKLVIDTLKIATKTDTATYVHYKLPKNITPEFDKIVLSNSGCFGHCPISNIMINNDGTLLYRGKRYTSKNGLYTSVISITRYRQLQDNFRKINFDSLQNKYNAGATDLPTTTITFVKNGKIFKSIEDYGQVAPYPFKWSYPPLENLYQAVSLKKINFPEFSGDTTNVIEDNFRKGNMIADLKQSESFLLFDYLRNGKVANTHFNKRFTIRVFQNQYSKTYYNLNTDGRYYTFMVKGKPLTIDIGFNFYDVNEKIWVWRKATEYD